MSSMMRLVTLGCDLADPVNGAAPIPAGTRIVVPHYASEHLRSLCRQQTIAPPRISRMGYYTRHYCGQALNGRRLLAWRGAGIGDQLIVAGCLAAIHGVFPDAHLGLMCDPNVARALYGGAENVPFEVVAEPVTLSDWQGWDYHWMVEGYCDGNYEPDQPDWWDGHLSAIGLVEEVSESRRRVFVPESGLWQKRASDFFDALPGTGPFILWQLAASTPMRSLPPDLTAECLRRLVAQYPTATILLAGTDREFDGYQEACDVPGIAATTRGLCLQEVFALVKVADLVVAPDSCLGHVAAAYETRCVSYWCPFPARSRAAHYVSHRIIEGHAECAPCWAHECGPINLQRGCPLAETDAAASRYCKGLAAITPETIVNAVRKEID